MRQAQFYRSLDHGEVECNLCAHYCRITTGQTGRCRVRHNLAGELLTSSYGHPVALSVEPIEKKYLFHAFPGSLTLSLGTPGCNLGCSYCINWRVSQEGVHDPDGAQVSPAEVVSQALARRVDCIAFTYSEPTIFYEYAEEIARLARERGLAVVAKSNGYMTKEVLCAMAGWLDAINIDLKGWQEESHRRVVGGDTVIVRENLRLAIELGIWVEVSTLLVPGVSDSLDDLERIATFIARDLGQDVPWHVLRFYPNYKMLDRPVTPEARLEQAVACARRAGLNHVYTKELAEGRMLHTYCPTCDQIVLERKGYRLQRCRLRHGCCEGCGQAIPGIGMEQDHPRPE